ncbi:MAG: M14 family metallopeptidase [Bacteroidales bacterium]
MPLRRLMLTAAACAFILSSSLVLTAQRGGGRGGGQGTGSPAKPMHRVGGTRDGVSVFLKTDYVQVRPLKAGEVDFKHFHTPAESLALMKTWVAKYPDLVELYSVGKSYEGADIWQVTITNKKTGRDADKPAFFIEGGRHAGESSGSEATLYFINHVLSNYGSDPAITKLVDTKALYCKPHNNPDGNTLYLTTAQTLRSTVRPNDDDNDGLLDEDPGEDLDGDGFVRQMRQFVGAGKGNAKKDPRDPAGRLMQRVQQGEGDYVLYPEGIDNDGDGRYNEDGIGGLDLHRNYPENWRPMREATGRGYAQGGSGEYPLSETETRAVFTFVMTHPNIAAAQTLDTAVPMILRGPSTERDEIAMAPDDLALLKKFDKKAQEITGYARAGDTYHEYATGGRPVDPVTGEGPRDSPIFGHSPDFGFSYVGIPWYGDEIWNGGRFVDYDKDGRVDEFEVMKWNDENRAGKGDFQNWTAFKHPQLGEVEIGGWNPKFYSQNPPPDLIETWAKNEALWNVWMAEQLPQVKIVSLAATPAKPAPPAKGKAAKGAPVPPPVSLEGVYDVTLTVTNEGQMPTALEIAKRVKMVRPDTCTLTLAAGQELLKAAQGKPQQRPAIEVGWLKAGETKTVTWQVKGTGKVTASVSSTRGGVDRKDAQVGTTGTM